MTYPWNAGEVLAAADLNAEFASKLPYSFGTATPSTTDSGFLWYDSNSTPAAPKFWDGSAFAPFGGKILQIVRATGPSSNVSTTSTSYVDVTSMSTSITPTRTDSAILLIFTGLASYPNTSFARYAITDTSNNLISGAPYELGANTGSGVGTLVMIAWSTPASTSSQTYKLRFLSVSGASATFYGNSSYGNQMLAIEVGA